MNTFGSSTRQFRLCDARRAREARRRFGRAAIPELDLATSFCATTGVEASRGWLLMVRSEYDQLDRYSTALQLSIGNPRNSDNTGTLTGLAIVQAQCVTRGIEEDADALYLVEVCDARGVLHNQWFSQPLVAAYNIRAPAYPQTFMTSSMNSGTTWTWATMLRDMWLSMPLLGSWPGLPITPAGTPEGFYFTGVPALPAMCEVLAHLGLTIAHDPTNSSVPYTIVDDGASDSTFTALQTKYKTHLEDDLEWIDTGAGRVPKTVKILFRRRNSVYGTEETVTYRNDNPYQWEMSAVYSVTTTAPSTFSSAVGTHHIWSDFTVRYDQENQPLAEDVTLANMIAAERTTQYFNRIYSGTTGWMQQTYAGALPFTTGSQVDHVQWYHTNERAGWRTRISRRPHQPPLLSPSPVIPQER